jgi:hypothetical protein
MQEAHEATLSTPTASGGEQPPVQRTIQLWGRRKGGLHVEAKRRRIEGADLDDAAALALKGLGSLPESG